MDVRRLGIFLAVVDEGGFTRAADALDLSQPAVSQAVRELETDLGTALFHRLGRTVRLTPAGEALVLPARQVRRDLENGRLAVEEVAALGTGRLDLACLPTLATTPTARLVGRYRERYPGVSIVLADPHDAEELLDAVRSGRAEVGLVEQVAADDLSTVRIATQDLLVVSPPGASVPDPFPLRRLGSVPLVAPPPGSSTRAVLDTALRRAGVAGTIVVQTALRDALVPLVVSGAGTALLPRPMADAAAALGCVVSAPRPHVLRHLALVHRTTALTPAAQRFVALAMEDRRTATTPTPATA
jgi:DNA-binding transcriptional LysR family regulator